HIVLIDPIPETAPEGEAGAHEVTLTPDDKAWLIGKVTENDRREARASSTTRAFNSRRNELISVTTDERSGRHIHCSTETEAQSISKIEIRDCINGVLDRSGVVSASPRIRSALGESGITDSTDHFRAKDLVAAGVAAPLPEDCTTVGGDPHSM